MKRRPLIGSLSLTFGEIAIIILCFIPFGYSQTTGTVKDIDGNRYKTIKIGTQWWMAENLKVTHYRNGEAIPNVTDGISWNSLTTGAFCNYDNNKDTVATYGRLYNWFAVGDSRNIAPAGWHVPTDKEWQTLVDFLGGDKAADEKMKEVGLAHWTGPNEDATNASGFSALPGGFRNVDEGDYYDIGDYAYFWSSTAYDKDSAWMRSLYYNNSEVEHSYYFMRHGFSVRCVKDN